MTRVYRAMVYLVTFAVPVVIAACYGAAYRYRKGGRVIDRATKDQISKIEVTCATTGSNRPGYTDISGRFEIQSDEPCTSLTATDALGPYDAGSGTFDAGTSDAGALDGGGPVDAGGGGSTERAARYFSKTVPVVDGDQTIELDRSN